MDYEIIWGKLCAEFSECSDEIRTGTGLWYKVSGDGKSIFIDNAVKNQPSCRSSMERKLSKKDFMFVSSY